jgi:hypothetical protein
LKQATTLKFNTVSAIIFSIHEKAVSQVSLIKQKIDIMDTQLTAGLPKLYIGIDMHKRSWKVHCCGQVYSDFSIL